MQALTVKEQIRQNRAKVDQIIACLTPEQIIDAFIIRPRVPHDGVTIVQHLLPGIIDHDCNETRRKKLKAKIYSFLAGLERRGIVAHAPDGWWYYSPEFIETEECQGKTFLVLWRLTEDDPTSPCLFCGSAHIHGESDGHRVAHCGNGVKAKPAGCFLQEARVGSFLLRQADGYIIRTRKPKK